MWDTAHYPDRSSGNRICVSRPTLENGQLFVRCSYPDRDTEMTFVFKEK